MAKLNTKPFDAAKYFETAEDVVDLLNDAVESGHAGYLAKALGVAARSEGMTTVSERAGVNRQALYAALSEDGNPTLDTLLKIANALGIKLRFEVAQREAA